VASFICAAVAAIILGIETSSTYGWALFLSLASINFMLDDIKDEIVRNMP
jgi:hypothetical protein